MHATAELQVIPLGRGVSVRHEVTRVVEILNGYDLVVEPHASGNNLEVYIGRILAAVERAHAALHTEGTVRIVSYLKLETRTDKKPTLAGKRL